MRRLILPVVVVLSCGAAIAQVFVGTERVSEPIAKSMRAASPAPAVAMARDRAGVAIAWSAAVDGVERIFVRRLETGAQAAGAITMLPASSSLLDAHSPSIAAAPNGDGFIVTWLETAPQKDATSAALYCRLDSALRPSTANVLMLFLPAGLPAPLVRSNDSTWIAAGPRLWHVRNDGVLDRMTDLPFAPASMTIADTPQLVTVRDDVVATTRSCVSDNTCKAMGGSAFGGCPPFLGGFRVCDVPIRANRLHFFAAGQPQEMTLQFDFRGSSDDAAIASNGRDTLVASFAGAQNSGGDVIVSHVDATSFQPFSRRQVVGTIAPHDESTRPDVAADEQRCIIVWRDGNDIAGAALDRDGRVTPLPIPSTASVERNPSVIALAKDLFVIAYEKVDGDRRFIAWRIVSFATRRRLT